MPELNRTQSKSTDSEHELICVTVGHPDQEHCIKEKRYTGTGLWKNPVHFHSFVSDRERHSLETGQAMGQEVDSVST